MPERLDGFFGILTMMCRDLTSLLTQSYEYVTYYCCRADLGRSIVCQKSDAIRDNKFEGCTCIEETLMRGLRAFWVNFISFEIFLKLNTCNARRLFCTAFVYVWCEVNIAKITVMH